MNGHTAKEDGPADHVDGSNGAVLKSDQGMEQTQDQSAAEALPEAPAIPAEMPAQIILPRLADRSAVTAPTDAIGELVSRCSLMHVVHRYSSGLVLKLGSQDHGCLQLPAKCVQLQPAFECPPHCTPSAAMHEMVIALCA